MRDIKRVYLDADYLIYLITSTLELKFYWVGFEVFNLKKDAQKYCQETQQDESLIVKQECMLPHWMVERKVEQVIESKIRMYNQKFPNATLVWFIDGKGNYRYDITDTYKSKRPPKPFYADYVREVLADKLKAIRIDNLEVDDAVAFFHTYDKDSVLSSIDKDHMNIIGRIYNPNKGELYETTEESTLKHFITQVITGDTVDSIQGIKGLGKVAAEEFLEAYKLPKDYKELLSYLERFCDTKGVAFDKEACKTDMLLLDIGGYMSERLGLEHPFEDLIQKTKERTKVYLNKRFNLGV